MYPWKDVPADLYLGIAKVIENYKKSCMDNGKTTAAEAGITLNGWLGGGGHPNNNKGATCDVVADAMCDGRHATWCGVAR